MKTKILPALCGLLLITAACRKEDAEEKQRQSIESYLGASYTAADGIYWKQLRHPMCDTAIITAILDADSAIVGYDTLAMEECRRITEGARVTFAYSGSVFRGALFATSSAAEAMAGGILPQPPLTVTVGQSKLTEGLHRALLQMTTGDSAHVVFPFTLGYGEGGSVGTVPPMSAQEWIIVIKEIQ